MSNTKKAAAVAKVATAATTNNNAVSVNKEHAKLSAVEVVELSAAWMKKYNTISTIRDNYAALVDEYGKDNFAAVLANCRTIRAAEINAAAETLNKDVFTFSGISAAVFNAVSRSVGYVELCKIARREYSGTDAERAAAVIRDYFAAVDETGAPLCKVSHVNAAVTEIYVTYEHKTLSFNNAVSILKSSLDGMKAAAVNAATRKTGNDNAAATRANVRAVGRVVSVYAAAVDETGIVSRGERRDTSKDERTRKNAAAVVGKSLPVGCVPVTTYNAAINGNDNAAAIVEDAQNAAKDAATRRAAVVAGKSSWEDVADAVKAKRDK